MVNATIINEGRRQFTQKNVRPGLGIGLFLVLWGIYSLLKSMGIIPPEVSLWPIFLIAAGFYLMTRKMRIFGF